MIEKVLYDYLNNELSVPAYMELPADGYPSSYILIEKTGSSRENHIERATIAIQSIAPTLYEAACLNQDVKDALDNAVELGAIASVRLNSDYNYTDQQKHEYRYQAVFDIVHY